MRPQPRRALTVLAAAAVLAVCAAVDDRDGTAATSPLFSATVEALRAAEATSAAPGRSLDAAYPRQQVLPEPPVDHSELSIKLGLTPYQAITPALNELPGPAATGSASRCWASRRADASCTW